MTTSCLDDNTKGFKLTKLGTIFLLLLFFFFGYKSIYKHSKFNGLDQEFNKIKEDMWRGIRDGWESFSKHVALVVGDGTRILFWHYKWVGDNLLKRLYPQLYVCSNDKEACISDVSCYQEGGHNRIWNLRFHRDFHERELEAAFSFLEFIQSQIPRGGGSDTSHQCLNENSKFDTQSYYNNIRGAVAFNFPWKGVWKAKISKRVAFFVWTAVYGQILILDNFMLRRRILVNWCCMCHQNEEIVDHLLLQCPIAHSLWVYMFQIFGTQWFMPGSMESLVYCWSYWLGKFNSDI